MNTIDLTWRSPSYENHFSKYRHHNFEVYWDGLDRSRIRFQPEYDDSGNIAAHFLTGLSRLIYVEDWFNGRFGAAREYYQKRGLKKIDDSRDPILTMPSGSATLDIPYGERFTAARVKKYVDQHADNHPHFFGTINEVVTQGMKRTKKNQEHLSGKITFIKDNPGRQMIGSFHPISDDDWTKGAYKEEGGGSESTS